MVESTLDDNETFYVDGVKIDRQVDSAGILKQTRRMRDLSPWTLTTNALK